MKNLGKKSGTRKTAPVEPAAVPGQEQKSDEANFPIVAIGASAGGWRR
ncbi:hypothetical protein [Geobacter sp. FeAm09]|nr:hypothetical protein [Geobacter sp. FeAm09]